MSREGQKFEEQKRYKLEELADIAAGSIAPKKDCFTSTGIPFVRAGSLGELLSGGSPSDLELLTSEMANNLRMRLFPAGTVVFAKSGMSCMTGNVYVLPEPCYVVSHLACVVPKKGLANYLKHYLRFNRPNRLIENPSFPSIKLSKIKKIEIKLPNLSTLESQTQVLESICEQIEKTKLQLQYLDSLVKSRFVEMFGDLRTNEKNWEMLSLENFVDIRDGTHDSPKYHNEGYPLITSKNVTSGKLDFSSANLISEQDYLKICKRSKVDFGDIIMPMIGTIGSPVIVDTSRPFAIKNVALIKFQDDAKLINSFVKELLSSDYFNDYVRQKNRGATQKFIALGNIRKLPTPVVPSGIQEKFADFVHQIDKSKSIAQKQIDKLQMLYDSLAQEYFGD